MKLNDFLIKLLSINSVSEEPKKLIEVIDLSEKYLISDSIKIKRFLINSKPCLVATMSNIKTPQIFLNCHLDVVPAEPEQFMPKVKDLKLYARGAQDMKASCAVMMKVFKDFASDKTFPRNKLGLMLVTDEEVGGHNGSKSLLRKGYKPDFLLTGEPTDLNIEVAAKGVLWLKFTSKGIAAHGAYPWKGKNAVEEMVSALKAVKKLYPTPKKEVWKTTCNIGSISGGNATNRVPDYCEVKLDIRFIPKDDPKTITNQIISELPRTVKAEVLMEEPFFQIDKSHPKLKLLKKIIKKTNGKIPQMKKMHGASDARFFSAAGIPTTSFGPVGAGLHSDHEWVSLKSLIVFENILKEFIRKF